MTAPRASTALDPPAALAVVLYTPADYRSIRSAVKNLVPQQRETAIELLIAGPATALASLTAADREDLAVFSEWRWVEVPAGTAFDDARAAAARRARAPIVAFAEDHAYPQPGWAATLVAAFAEDWSAVGPVLENANPGTLTSWANFLLEYGPWTSPTPRGAPAAHLPGHNSAYRRELLASFGDELATVLGAESLLHWRLVEQGHRLTLDPGVRTRHLNFSRVAPSCTLRFQVGRLFGSSRCVHWSVVKRLAYTGAVPLIALVRIARVARLPVLRAEAGLRWRLLPILTLFSSLAALGEGAGYLTRAAGSATAYLSDVESDRFRFFARTDTIGR